MNFNSKIITPSNTSLILEIYYITREGTVFQFHDFVDNVTKEINPDNPDKVRFNWSWEEKVKIKINHLINELSKYTVINKKSVIGIYEEGHLIKHFDNVDCSFKPPINSKS